MDRFGVAGWAEAGAVLRVAGCAAAVVADRCRPDLPDDAAAFAAWFDQPLSTDGTISVNRPDGSHLPGSPWHYAAQAPVAVWRPDDGAPLALVIDTAPPDAARDAGSAALLSHMAALGSLGYAVRFATLADAPAAMAATAGRVRLAYVHRLAAAALTPWLRAANPGVYVIYAVADLQHLRAAREACVLGGTGPANLRTAELTAAREADAVITHSSVEAALLRASLPGARVAVVPWAVVPRPVDVAFAERRGIGFIGSYGHAPNADAARMLLDDVMPLVWRTHRIPCVLAGSGMPPWLRARAGDLVQIVEPLPDVMDLWRMVRVSAAPLRFGAGVKGKVLDSLAAGIPCACSRIAAEGLALPAALRADGAEATAATLLHLHENADANAAAATLGAAVLASAQDVAAAIFALTQ